MPELNNFKIITDYCIGADGKVDSVKLYSQVPVEDIETVILDYQSKTSVTLIKILAMRHWKANFNFIDATPGYEKNITEQTAAVIIGDRTFELNGNFKYEYDLAEEWKKLTGLPFAFAAWVAITPVDENFLNDFNRALKWGVNNIDKAILKDGSKFSKKFNRADYLKNKIRYELDDKKRIAIELFVEYMKHL